MIVGAWLVVEGINPFVCERREPVAVGDYFVQDGQYRVSVETCRGEPAVSVLEEAADEVRVQVVSTTRLWGDSAACADSVVLTLSSALGTRDLVDLTTGRVIED